MTSGVSEAPLRFVEAQASTKILKMSTFHVPEAVGRLWFRGLGCRA